MSLFRSGYGRQSLKKVESERRPNRCLGENGRGIPSRHHSVRLAPLAPVEIQTIGKYRLIKTIGKGNFAKVKLAKHVPTGRQVAIKVIDKTMLSSTTKAKLWREVRIMKSLDHPNIVKLFEVMETDRYLYLVMEYASGGELFDYLTTHGRLKEKEARVKFRQILSAVHYFHQKNIVHRDLKAENLLLDQDLNIKIADFGFSNEFCLGSKLDTFCGSPPYAAPELFLGKRYIGPEVDVWSLGVVLYTLATGSLPFDGHNLKELREKIIKGKFKVPFFVTSECEHLLKKFLVTNPSKRILLETAMKDKWVNQGYEGTELKPFKEPSEVLDEDRIDIMINMGFNREEICRSLNMHSYDDTMATYLLLKVKPMLDNSSSYTWSNISLGRSNTTIISRPPITQALPSATRAPSHPACVSMNTPFVSSVPKTEIKVIDDTPGSPYKKRNAAIFDELLPSRPQPQPRNLVKKFHDQQAARRESLDLLGMKVKDEKGPTYENPILNKGIRQRSYDNALMDAGNPPEPFQRITSFRIPSSNFGHHSPKTEELPSDYMIPRSASSVRTRYPKKLDNASVIETAIEGDECPQKSSDYQKNYNKMTIGADVNLTGRPELSGATSFLSPWKGPSIPYIHHAPSSHPNNPRCTNMNSVCTTPSPSTSGLVPLKSNQQQILPSQFYSSGPRPQNYPESLSNHRSIWSPINSPSRPDDGYLANDLAALSSSHRGHSPPPQQLVRNVAGRRTVHGGTVHDRKKIEATLVGVSKLTIDGDTFGSACDARLGWTESEKRKKEASKEQKKPEEKNESKSGKSSIGRSGRFSFLNKLASKLGRNK